MWQSDIWIVPSHGMEHQPATYLLKEGGAKGEHSLGSIRWCMPFLDFCWGSPTRWGRWRPTRWGRGRSRWWGRGRSRRWGSPPGGQPARGCGPKRCGPLPFPPWPPFRSPASGAKKRGQRPVRRQFFQGGAPSNNSFIGDNYKLYL